MRRNKGFTLIELLIALLIISMVAGLLVISYKEYIDADSKMKESFIQMTSLNTVINIVNQDIEKGTLTKSGTINGLHYSYKSRVISNKKIVDPHMNKEIVLYLIEVQLLFNGKSFSWNVIKYGN